MEQYRGVTAQQKDGALSVIEDFLIRVNPKNILEVGTGMGAISFMARELFPASKLVTVDRSYYPTHEILYKNGIVPLYWDIHDQDSAKFADFANIFIQSPGATVVLVDNGKKPDEFNFLAQFLKPGDYILSHDYAKTRDMKVWEFLPEICEADIKETCERYNLIDVLPEVFNAYAWTCWRKK